MSYELEGLADELVEALHNNADAFETPTNCFVLRNEDNAVLHLLYEDGSQYTVTVRRYEPRR